MKAYVVGGWVRDTLLAQQGYPVRPGDRDWVVVGATPQQMLALGYRPVGRDFPVFLHPRTHEEYALARTERKTAPGYRGFAVHAAPEVTLEQDLGRRDLTINAMALDENGGLIDPLGGAADLQARLLRHVGPAFVEDPVRILRLARFAARLPEFHVAPATLALMQGMIAAGEGDALVPERIWQELARGLMAERPARMIEVLQQSGLLARLTPGLQVDAQLLGALGCAAARAAPLAVRFAILTSGAAAAPALQTWLDRLRPDNDCRHLAVLLHTLRAPLQQPAQLDAVVAVLERADVLRRGARFSQLLLVLECLDRRDQRHWQTAALAYGAVDAGAVAAAAGADPGAIARAVQAARRAAVAQSLALG